MIERLCKIPKSNSFFLFGPRGCGKSTLLKAHFDAFKEMGSSQVLWVDLLESKLHYELSQDPERLLEMWAVNKPEWVVIDEVQKIPALLDSVHKGIEEYKIKCALSGSSARKLKKGAANLLGGRAFALSLSTFSFFEVRKIFDLNKAINFGLLPRFWAEEIADADIVRSLYGYVDVYLKEEVAAEQLVRNLDPFRRFLRVAAQSNALTINFSKIERDAGLGASQAKKHFDILVDTLIGSFLEPYHNSIRKRQEKSSKFYFFDTGVVRALNLLAGESLHESTYEYGNLFETFVVNEFFKLSKALEKKWKFSYLRTQAGVEIDLIIEKPRAKPILIEIKSSKEVKREHLKNLNQVSFDFKGSEKYLLYTGGREFMKNDIRCLPWEKGLEEIFDL